METFAFATEDEDSGCTEGDLVVILLAAFVEAIEPVALFLELVHLLADVADFDDGQVLDGAGGGFDDGFGDACGAAVGDEESIDAGGVSGANDGSEVVRIFDTVEEDEALGAGEIVEGGVFLGCSESDDALMDGAFGSAFEGFTGLEADGDVGLAGEVDDFLEFGTGGAFGDEDAVELTACAKGFATSAARARAAPSSASTATWT